MPRLQIPSAISPQGRLSGNVQAPAGALADTGGVQAWGAVRQAGGAIAGAVAQIGEYRQRLQNAVDEGEAARIKAEWQKHDAEMQIAQKSTGFDPSMGEEAYQVPLLSANERSRLLLDENKTLSKEARRRLANELTLREGTRQVETINHANAAKREYATASLVDGINRLAADGNFEAAKALAGTAQSTGAISQGRRLEMEGKFPELKDNSDMDKKYYSDPAGLIRDIDAGLYKNSSEAHKRSMRTSAMVEVGRRQSAIYTGITADAIDGKEPTEHTYIAAAATGQISLDQRNDGILSVRRLQAYREAQAKKEKTEKRPWTVEGIVQVQTLTAAVTEGNWVARAAAEEAVAMQNFEAGTAKAMNDEIAKRFEPAKSVEDKEARRILDNYKKDIFTVAVNFYAEIDKREAKRQPGAVADRHLELLNRRAAAEAHATQVFMDTKDEKKAREAYMSHFKREFSTVAIRNIVMPTLQFDATKVRQMDAAAKGNK